MIKIPLGTLLLGFLGLVARGALKRKEGSPRFRDELILLFPAVVIFVVVSSKTGFNEHFRYVLPAFPYFFVFLASWLRIRLTSGRRTLESRLTR